MTVPYCTPAAVDQSADVDTCLEASELIDQYLGGQTLAWQAETLRLRAFQIDRDTRYTLALPRRPICEAKGLDGAELALERTLAADGAPYPPIGRITAAKAPWAGPSINISAIWGWPEPDRGNTRTIDLAALIDGDVDAGTQINETVDTAAGECWWIYEPGADPGQWHCETAYVKNGALVRYAEASGGNYALGSGAKAQRIVWPQGLAGAAATIARRLKQIKTSPGNRAFDNPGGGALLHNVTRSLDRYRPL